MVCHLRLAEHRPHPAHLTGYFAAIALGGVLGSLFVVLVAPAVFSSILEYPLAIAAAILLCPQVTAARRPLGVARRRGSALHRCDGQQRRAHQRRSVAPRTDVLRRAPRHVRPGWRVARADPRHDHPWRASHRRKGRLLPTAYYHPSGPIGDTVFALSAEGRFHDVAVIGLGAGALAGYAGNGVRMDFFEVDDAAIRIAEDPDYFTYLSEARARPGATIRTIARDGRIGLHEMPEASYDLIVVDAFSSDAIPTHLLTLEAVAIYESRLKPRGVLAFHVSNRFFALAPVLARIADERRLVCYGRDDRDVPPDQLGEAKRPSVWVLMARDERDIGSIAQSAPRWSDWRALARREARHSWTDDYSNVLGVLLEPSASIP